MEDWKQQSRRAGRRLHYLVSRYGQDECSRIAAALTYMTLFALVPMLTVTYTMASAIPTAQGLEEQMQALLFDNLLPEASGQIQGYLSDFSDQARSLTGVGIGFIVVTAVLMLRNIERAFNTIWRTGENRSALSSFLLYWAVLSLSPVFIGLALGISTYVAVLLRTVDSLGIGAYLLQYASIFLSWAAFSLLYVAVPNCRVPFKHALLGGLLAALAFMLARSLFTSLLINSNYTLIYGAFAAVPLFLLWIYLCWNIVLVGGIVTHSLSAYQDQEQAARPQVLKALDVLYLLWSGQREGSSVREIEILGNRHAVTRGLDSDTWREIRNVLIAHRVISQDDRGHYLLSRKLSDISFGQLKAWINDERSLDSSPPPAADISWQDEAHRLLLDQRQQQRDLLGISLEELFSK